MAGRHRHEHKDDQRNNEGTKLPSAFESMKLTKSKAGSLIPAGAAESRMAGWHRHEHKDEST
jgi:hypothetical protein